MDETHNQDSALAKRDTILSTLTIAAEVFLRGSLETWTDNVLQVLRCLGKELGVTRIFLCKHKEVTSVTVETAMRYEWLQAGEQTRIDIPDFQQINLQAAGLGRWAGILYSGGVIAGKKSDLPPGEWAYFLSPDWNSLIIVPVFVESIWWGFIGFENYTFDGGISTAELDAFKTVAVTFGAAIRRKRMEESLMRERAMVVQKAREVEDIAKFPSEDPWPILRIKDDGALTYANRAAEPLLNQWGVGVGIKVPDEWQQRVMTSLATVKMQSTDVKIDTKTYAMLTVPVVSGGYVNIYGHEVTKERELDKIKSEFLAIASHQLRSPLTSIRWYTERLLSKCEGLGQEQVEMAEVIHTSAIRLAWLVDDLLNLSRVERGKIEPEPSLNDFNKMIAEVSVELKGQVESNGMQLVSELDPVIVSFYFDSNLLRQVVMNLLTNALKYSKPKGVVKIRTYLFDTTYVGCEVIDQGIGIPETEQEQVFSRFFRAHNAIGFTSEGTGLGLALVKLVIEKSGGRVWFTSEENKGSVFTFILPYYRTQAEAKQGRIEVQDGLGVY
jgi:signal transduction histidine kinase